MVSRRHIRWLEPVIGMVTVVACTLNTLAVTLPLFVLALVKACLPIASVRQTLSGWLNNLASAWISINNLGQRLLHRTQVRTTGLTGLDPDGWYLVLANHQSWVDIVILQRVLNRKIPLLKFFLKQQLFYVPVLGLAWWALDFPFMKRYSKSFLKKHPHLKGKDFDTTKEACRKFKHLPVSVMNFVEGTRFKPEKHKRQSSPFARLLKPRGGGVGLVLGAMGDTLNQVVDVTIAYPNERPYFWDFVCGRLSRVDVHVRVLPITEELVGDYARDNLYRRRIHKWLNGMWEEKDRRLGEMMSGGQHASTDPPVPEKATSQTADSACG